jgi:hypothetical protein
LKRDERVYNISPRLKFTLREEHLIEEGSRGTRRWRQAWPLQQLSPELESISGRPQGTKETLVGGAIMVGVALAIYFSELNPQAPLVAPLILIIGLVLLGRVLQNFRVETWTTIRKWDGSSATSFSHRDCDPAERRIFEDALVDAVRDIRRTRGDA